MELKGRHALVTGGGRGIGRATALALAGAGASVTLSARTKKEIDAVAEEVRALGVRALAVPADVAKAADVKALFAAAREALGPVDILVNGAGIAPSAPLARTSDEMWDQVLAVNLSGVFYGLREALPEMTSRGWGRVVNIASIAGKSGDALHRRLRGEQARRPRPHQGGGARGRPEGRDRERGLPGLRGHADDRRRHRPHRRRRPGQAPEEIRKHLESTLSPQKRLVTSEEVAALVLFLCGEAARGITGQALNVDGGSRM